jgi:hypothetical protein
MTKYSIAVNLARYHNLAQTAVRNLTWTATASSRTMATQPRHCSLAQKAAKYKDLAQTTGRCHNRTGRFFSLARMAVRTYDRAGGLYDLVRTIAMSYDRAGRIYILARTAVRPYGCVEGLYDFA